MWYSYLIEHQKLPKVDIFHQSSSITSLELGTIILLLLRIWVKTPKFGGEFGGARGTRAPPPPRIKNRPGRINNARKFINLTSDTTQNIPGAEGANQIHEGGHRWHCVAKNTSKKALIHTNMTGKNINKKFDN